ncbi:MAG TPA: trypsin-like peptidase domain-containing protein [Bacilli bacterium]|nr:trypsin-like peptidase domain-containing protein [Bacilli bacterium]
MNNNIEKENKIKIVLITSIITLIVGIFGSYIFFKYNPKIFGNNDSKNNTTKVVKDVTVTDTGISEAVDKVYNSVVVVGTYKGEEMNASGSGFVYKKSNNKMYILTNNHVIESGDNYKVTYTDDQVATAKLVGKDEYLDVAVLEVDNKDNIDAVEIGESSELKPGDTVFAVGTPLDATYSWTVTRGIISGKERLVEVSLSNSNSSDYIMNVIQTDAAVNSGNSGGPLSNSNGAVIGIISAKISSSGVEGMGFAIPIELAIEKAEKITSGDNTEYPYLGVSMVNAKDANYYKKYSNNLTTNLTSGVMIVDIENDSLAEKAGLKSGDVITKINDEEVSNIAYFRYELYKNKIGDKITITYNRDGKEKTIEVELK